MELQWIGLAAAGATFFGIWFGHVTVRKVEASVEKLWQPIAVCIALGVGLEAWSLLAGSRVLSTATAILGITVLWDAFEFYRQEKRIFHGHAPANPGNHRHRLILAKSEHATIIDLLNRNPSGRLVTPEEAVRLVLENDVRPPSADEEATLVKGGGA